jgi:hypothetical protein
VEDINMPEEQQDCTMNTLFNKIVKIGNGMERFDERQEKIAEDVAKIKEAVYNPDSGIYSRLRELENWKDTMSKVIWGVVFSVTVLLTASAYKLFIAF